MRRLIAGLSFVFVAHCSLGARAAGEIEAWPQFRGPNAAGVAADDQPLPVEFGPDKNIAWKTAIPAGHSSPCLWGDRVFLTAFDTGTKRLEVLCLDRRDGRILWRQPVAAEKLEHVHQISSPATATPAADAERVYCYFGSVGLICFDHDGQEQWKVPLALPRRMFGSGTSPVVAGELVLLSRDERPDPHLWAFDRRTGAVVWKQKYEVQSGFGPPQDGYATAVVRDNQVIVHRASEIAAYGLADGQRTWWVRVNSNGATTPVLRDGLIYVATWNNFGEPELRVEMPSFAKLIEQHDKDQDGRLSKDEFPGDLALSRRPDTSADQGGEIMAKWFFDRIDANQDGHVASLEWTGAVALLRLMLGPSEHGLLAIKLGGEGDVTHTHVAWREQRNIPEVPSPLEYQGRVYMVRNGGILTCLEASSGKLLFRSRLEAPGSYYSSPVSGDGKVYTASQEGRIVVLAAGDRLEVLARNDLGEPVFATPAIAGGTLYVRTEADLWAFRAHAESP